MSESNGFALGRRRSRVEADRLVSEFEQSGLTRRAFCAQHGLSAATLDNYGKRRRETGSGQAGAKPESRIFPVEFVSETPQPVMSAAEIRSALWVELANGRRIAVSHGFDGATLERLIAVLEQA